MARVLQTGVGVEPDSVVAAVDRGVLLKVGIVVDVAIVEVVNDLPVVVILDVAVILNSAATSGLLLVVFILADLNQLGVH